MSLKKLIEENLVNYGILEESDCGCGCDKCGDKMSLLESKAPISEGLRYHIENGISLQESVFRIGSKKYFQMFAEARMLNEWGTIQLDENSRYLVENTDIGKFGIYEGEKVPLDVPVINEKYDKEAVNEFLSKLVGKAAKFVGIQKIADIVLNKLAERLPEDKQDLILDLKPVIASAISLGKIATVKELVDYLMDNGGELKDLIAAEIPGLLQKLRLAESELEEGRKKKKKKKKKDPPIGKPKRGGSKAYYVYVRNPKTKKVKKVSFGSGGLRAKIRNPKARNAFAKRHKCSQKKDRTKASYWSCNLPRYAPALGLGPKMNTYW